MDNTLTFGIAVVGLCVTRVKCKRGKPKTFNAGGTAGKIQYPVPSIYDFEIIYARDFLMYRNIIPYIKKRSLKTVHLKRLPHI